jgi:hypothetical protein
MSVAPFTKDVCHALTEQTPIPVYNSYKRALMNWKSGGNSKGNVAELLLCIHFLTCFKIIGPQEACAQNGYFNFGFSLHQILCKTFAEIPVKKVTMFYLTHFHNK